jgi:transcriptional regulator with XRE-family HTH domain
MGLSMSQTVLGNAIGVTFQQIQKYENGANRIGASNLFKIADVMSADVGFFYGGMPEEVSKWNKNNSTKVPHNNSALHKKDPMNSREGIELLHNYFRISSPNLRRQISQLVKSMAETE